MRIVTLKDRGKAPLLSHQSARSILLGCVILLGSFASQGAVAAELPIIDAHIHYSHDAWERWPTDQVVEIFQSAGLKRAFVSSSSDEGTQRLKRAAPELVVPVLRPYRQRGETRTWMRDNTVIDMLKDRLSRYEYAGIGEFHVYGADAELPVMQAVVALASTHRLFLHAHADVDAVDIIFVQDPEALVLWAHGGFESVKTIEAALDRYPSLWVDLAFRSEHYRGSGVDPAWRALFEKHPDRFMVGTDTYTPGRWSDVVSHARTSRDWLRDLPDAIANKIAYENAEALLGRVNYP